MPSEKSFPCFNLVIEILLISSLRAIAEALINKYRFNLVIEILLISSSFTFSNDRSRVSTFQSRNRDTSDFKSAVTKSSGNGCASSFQSRNRDTSDFKYKEYPTTPEEAFCFNLVIEILLISSEMQCAEQLTLFAFQSRNRDTSDFKCSKTPQKTFYHLFQSRNRDTSDFKLMSSSVSKDVSFMFQSRNRDTSDFKRSTCA